jgi:hypothetical protein
LKEAVLAEESGSIITCRSIIKETMKYGMDEFLEGHLQNDAQHEKERVIVYKRVWNENAEACTE